jgi:hypothetical protein
MESANYTKTGTGTVTAGERVMIHHEDRLMNWLAAAYCYVKLPESAE